MSIGLRVVIDLQVNVGNQFVDEILPEAALKVLDHPSLRPLLVLLLVAFALHWPIPSPSLNYQVHVNGISNGVVQLSVHLHLQVNLLRQSLLERHVRSEFLQDPICEA